MLEPKSLPQVLIKRFFLFIFFLKKINQMLTFLNMGLLWNVGVGSLNCFIQAFCLHLKVSFGSSLLHLLFPMPVLHISQDCWVDCQDWSYRARNKQGIIILFFLLLRLYRDEAASVSSSQLYTVPFKNVSRTFLDSSHSIESDRISGAEKEGHSLWNSASREGILHKARQRGSPEVSLQPFLTWY